MALTAQERETVISISDADDSWLITTCQRPQVTQLLRNPTAEIISDTTFEGTRIVTAKIPAAGVTIRKAVKGSRRVSKRKGMPSTAATCNGVKADGSKCGSLAAKDTGFCIKHQDQK